MEISGLTKIYLSPQYDSSENEPHPDLVLQFSDRDALTIEEIFRLSPLGKQNHYQLRAHSFEFKALQILLQKLVNEKMLREKKEAEEASNPDRIIVKFPGIETTPSPQTSSIDEIEAAIVFMSNDDIQFVSYSMTDKVTGMRQKTLELRFISQAPSLKPPGIPFDPYFRPVETTEQYLLRLNQLQYLLSMDHFPSKSGAYISDTFETMFHRALRAGEQHSLTHWAHIEQFFLVPTSSEMNPKRQLAAHISSIIHQGTLHIGEQEKQSDLFQAILDAIKTSNGENLSFERFFELFEEDCLHLNIEKWKFLSDSEIDKIHTDTQLPYARDEMYASFAKAKVHEFWEYIDIVIQEIKQLLSSTPYQDRTFDEEIISLYYGLAFPGISLQSSQTEKAQVLLFEGKPVTAIEADHDKQYIIIRTALETVTFQMSSLYFPPNNHQSIDE